MIRRASIFPSLVAAAAVASCGGLTTRTDSTVQGHLDVASFPSTPTAIQARDEHGNVVQAALNAGQFSLKLPQGHKYQLDVLMSGGQEPVVFPRGDGSLDLDFKISGAGAVVQLGAIHHFDSAPIGGFVIKTTASGEGEVGECVDGTIMGSGEACVDDDAKATCEAGDDNEQEGEHQDADESDGDGECENGVDLATGAACVDEPEADPTKPMAVAEHNAPEDVGGCDDEEEEDGEED